MNDFPARFGAVSLLVFSLLLLPRFLLAGDTPQRITVDQVKALLDNGETVVFFDTRRGPDWDASDVKLPDAVRINDSAALAAAVNNLSGEEKIVTYCS